MRTYQKLLSILCIVLLVSYNIQASTCDSTSLKLMEQTWREFRAIHPFGYQTVGLRNMGDTCIYVISEPADWVKTEDLVALFSKHNGHLIECIQPYGYDGELHDYVGCLRKDSINPQVFKSELFKLLYYTDYKAYYTDLDNPAKHVYFSNKEININITTSYLEIALRNEIFEVPSKKFLSFNNLIKSKTISDKLYFSKNRGFVVWVLDSVGISQSDSVFLKTARRFALNTDLILGSFYKYGKVAIIGREREISVNILPPLRSETIRQLLTCKGRYLYLHPNKRKGFVPTCLEERYSNNPWLVFNSFQTDSLQHDVYSTPIYIGRMPRNTELGNLMYLTDIILKSWCENGKIKDRFINYPLPNSFPYPNGLTHEISIYSEIYWNLLDPLLKYDYNTGCCFPFISSFITKKDSTWVEKEIQTSLNLYSYFAEQQCVVLVRVKQYSILLSAFQNLPVRQSEIQEINRQKTPSITVSNKKWLFGGYPPQVPVVPVTARRFAQSTQKALEAAARKAKNAGTNAAKNAGINAAKNAGINAAEKAEPAIKLLQKATTNETLNTFPNLGSKFRKDVIHTQSSGSKRGFDPKIHNTPSKNLLLSDPEKQELLDKSDKEKEMMENLRLQLRQSNIPVEVIQNEQDIIIYTIIILKNHDEGYDYKWTA